MTVFLGIGTGRCGTMSLAGIVGACENARVTHEHGPYRSPWDRLDDAALDRFVADAQAASASGTIFGDVALYWLPHVEAVRARLPDLKVVCLKRDRTQTVASFLKKCPGWSPLREKDRACDPEWFDLFPTLPIDDLAEGWGAYWDNYYRQAELIPGVIHVHTGDLDDDMAATGLLNALGVPADRQRLPKLRRLNTSADTLVSLPRV